MVADCCLIVVVFVVEVASIASFFPSDNDRKQLPQSVQSVPIEQ